MVRTAGTVSNDVYKVVTVKMVPMLDINQVIVLQQRRYELDLVDLPQFSQNN